MIRLRALYLFLVVAMICTLILGGSGPLTNTYAQGVGTPAPDAVKFEIEGVVASVSADALTLTDGTVIRIPPGVLTSTLQPGMTVIVIVIIDGDDFILVTIIIVISPTPDATGEPTSEPTMEPTAEPTTEPTVEPTAEPTVEPTAEPTLTAGCPEAQHSHPVGLRMAEAYGVSYEEIMGWKCAGFGFGEIAKAYQWAALSGLTVREIFAMKAGGMGWGEIRKTVFSRSSVSISTADAPVKVKKGKGGKSVGVGSSPATTGNPSAGENPGKGKGKQDDKGGKGKSGK